FCADAAATAIYALSLHDALPISVWSCCCRWCLAIPPGPTVSSAARSVPTRATTDASRHRNARRASPLPVSTHTGGSPPTTEHRHGPARLPEAAVQAPAAVLPPQDLAHG